MFDRIIQKVVAEKVNSGKAIVIVGARQVGKTTFLKGILKDITYLFLDGDDPATRTMLTGPNTEQIRTFLGEYKYVFFG